MRKGLLIFFLLLPLTGAEELTELFHSSLDFYDDLQRTPEGFYRDAYHLDQREDHRCSTAAIGIGLIALCMEHELGRDPLAEKKALETLRALNGQTLGRDKAGYFRHFFSSKTGKGTSEFSTIDTAIMVIGALSCRNTFENENLKSEADALWNSINWQAALASPSGDRLFMIMKDGKGEAITRLFNEYYLLAWLINEDKKGSLPPINKLPTWKHRGFNLLSEPRHTALSSFAIQFPLYLCHPCTKDPRYLEFVTAQAKIDQLTSSKQNGSAELWGCGAGMTPANGYLASRFDHNLGKVVTPHIIAGFIPALPAAKDHLLKLYRDPKHHAETPVGKLLPRFSIDQPEWRADRIESIDYSSMIFGLAADHPKLGMRFFQEMTHFTFKNSPDRPAMKD